MPRGKYVNHKGRSRNFASAEELEEKHKKKELKKANRDEDDSDDSDESSSEEETTKRQSGSGSDEDSSEEESSSEDENKKKKGVSGLIEIENPNHVRRKVTKVTKVDVNAGSSGSGAGRSTKPELSRREREELDKQRAAANYAKLHAEGKTEQARADLARLAIIKQHRAEAAARREQEKKEKDDKAAKGKK